MNHNLSCLQNNCLNPQPTLRAKQLHFFYAFKAKNQFIGRQMLYLGIAILDKYSSIEGNKRAQSSKIETVEREMQENAISSLWIACKFLHNDHMPLSKFMILCGLDSLLKHQILEKQTRILQVIDFEIPMESAFTAMTKAYQQSQRQRLNQKQLVTQCLIFLREGLLLSSDFSLCSELGIQILRFFETHSVRDTRIKEVCASIHIKNRRRKQSEQNICQQILGH